MDIIGVLKKKFNYSVEIPGAGRLVYREGNQEYTFPVYEENGAVVVVGVPSSMRVHYFFGWYRCGLNFTDEDGRRILPRLETHLRAEALNVRVFERGAEPLTSFDFYPELFEYQGRASELLEAGGYTWFRDYGSIGLVHEDYGLEIGGIKRDQDVKPVLDILRAGLPHWHHHHYCYHEGDMEPGWTVSVSMFPPKACRSGQCEGE